MQLKEATESEKILLNLWGAYLDKTIESNRKDEEATQKEKERLQDLFIAHFRESGLEPPAPTAPIMLMFISFVGGVQALLDIPEQTENS